MRDLVQSCNGTGTCARCRGAGVHMRESFEEYECEVCGGEGECPCVHDSTLHAQPATHVGNERTS